jgi:hypothetical protein
MFIKNNMSKTIYFKINSVIEDKSSESRNFELFYDKYREIKEFKTHEQAHAEYINEGSKHYLFARIYSISVGIVDEENNNIRIKVIKGENEASIINTFLNVYSSEFGKEAKTVLWNADFTLPFLSMRALKNKIRITIPALKTFGVKAWSLNCFDLFNHLFSLGNYKCSLEELSYLNGLSTSEFIDYTTVNHLIAAKEEQLIDNSSIQELKNIVNLHRIIITDSPVIEDVVSVVEEVEVEVEKAELPLLERLYTENIFSADIKEKLIKLLAKKKLTKKDKENLFVILRGVYIRNNFENNDVDSKTVIAAKEKEIQEFIDSLK